MLVAAADHGFIVLFVLLAFLAASVVLGTFAQRSLEKKKFLEGFLLGNRGLGAWTLALTATVQSGGTFMGVPSLVYSHGWIVALWISSYMVVPLTGFAMIGKRVAQLSRRTGALTVPDLFRERFDDARVGVVASLMIIFFLSFTMFAQFKAGATIMKLAWPGSGMMSFSEDIVEEGPKAEAKKPGLDYKYLVGLTVFAVTVVGYTMIGGFLASVWTDLFQSVLMVIGVTILLFLAVPAAGGLQHATEAAVASTGPEFAMGPGYNSAGRQFLTPGLAVSMFFLWIYSGFASPASMIRVMAAHNTEVIRKSITLLSVYNCLIYLPIIIIAICGRAIFPALEKPDEIIPTLAMHLTQGIPGGSLITALVLTAPFGAIMASVSCFVLVIASGLVQDLYLRFIHPTATEVQIRRATRLAMMLVGIVGVIAVLNPPMYLQALIVFSGSAGAAAFVTPAFMACYWRRGTAAGVLAAMISGFSVLLVLYATGWIHNWALAVGDNATGWALSIQRALGPDLMIGAATAFRPYFVLGIDPVIWAMLASAVVGISVSFVTRPPSEEHLQRVYDGPQRLQTAGAISA
ncbi:MAG TPA: sodium:solute symporter [Planctomycetaceae bacterium]|nr:sodium:solute symporter [Planctomycetaceae bacterium]